MEQTIIKPRLSLNKKVISRLQHYRSNGKIVAYATEAFCGTRDCTIPECGSIVFNCRTDSLKSCAPCVPPPVDPGGTTKGC